MEPQGRTRGGVSKGGAGGVLGLRTELGKGSSGPLGESGRDGAWLVRRTSEDTAGASHRQPVSPAELSHSLCSNTACPWTPPACTQNGTLALSASVTWTPGAPKQALDTQAGVERRSHSCAGGRAEGAQVSWRVLFKD